MQSHQQELSLVPKDMGIRVAEHTCAIGFWVTLGWSRRGGPGDDAQPMDEEECHQQAMQPLYAAGGWADDLLCTQSTY